jgi:hypothetical protein
MAKALRWATLPADDDYAAAARYLSLLMPDDRASSVAAGLRSGPIVQHRANDLLRASGLSLLTPDDPEVAKDLKKVKEGTKLSPVLLVRGELGVTLRTLTVADGYHRICASYHLDPDNEIPCRIVDPTS